MTAPPIKPEVKWRQWWSSPARFLAEAEGYVMVRRKGGMPFVISKREWEQCEPTDNPSRARAGGPR